METSLHQQLKSLYATGGAKTEVRLGRYRIDVVRRDELIEVQHGALAALRDKVAHLLSEHRVRVVKPIVAQKTLVKLDRRQGRVVSRRRSPKRGTLLDVFDELVHFTRVFPHPRLTLELVLVEIEEFRYPGHGRRRRRRANDFQVADQTLVAVQQKKRLTTAADLRRLLPGRLPGTFHTADLAARLGVNRWVAQRIAYCLRQTGAVDQVGKQGNTLLYRTAA